MTIQVHKKRLRNLIGLGLIGLWTAALCSMADELNVNDIRLWSSPEGDRLVLDVSAEPQHRIFKLSRPERIVVDVKDAKANPTLSTASLNSSLIKGVRLGVQNDGRLRVVLDINLPVVPEVSVLKPNQQYGHRLVIDLHPTQRPPDKAPEPIKRITDLGLRDIIVAIDAGHGGEDPGAIGPRGTFEKNITLSIAKHLANMVQREQGMVPVLTRQGDYFISLRERIKKARDARADIFVSIHADSFTNPHAHGSSVYVLSNRGASSEAARWLAERENASDLIGGIESVSLKDKDATLASVLLDLSMTATQEASVGVANQVLSSLKSVNHLHKPHIEQAGFVVLKSPDIPSILIETAFISNRAEEAKLLSTNHQKKLARAILSGIKGYFAEIELPGTLYALKTHRVQSGESLSVLAERYQISVEALRRANQLTSDTLVIGQNLRIP